MKMSNEQMAAYIDVLSSLEESGRLGYAIARNTRKLKDASKEYLEMRAEVFREYGTVVDKERGRASVPVEVFNEKLGDIKGIEHDVEIYMIDEETFLSGSLSSRQMQDLLWMVKE